MFVEPLIFIPKERWNELKLAFKSDWPRSVSVFTLLETEEYILKSGCDYGFKVYCPYGNINNGIVALNIKNLFYEIIIQCPNDETKELEDAIRNTKIIDWNKNIHVPFAPTHVTDFVKRLFMEKKCIIDYIDITETFILDKNAPRFNIRLSPGFTFEHLPLDYVDLINDTWPHKHPGSEWFFNLLIKAKLGYGLFNGKELLSWVFIKEMGALGHLYTLEKHRKKGYGELILKLISNKLLENGKHVVAFCIKGNLRAANLYKKLEFENVKYLKMFITTKKV